MALPNLRNPFHVVLSLALGFPLLLGLVVWTCSGLRSLYYTHAVELDLGEPAYQNLRTTRGAPDPFTDAQRAALLTFPDVASCIGSKPATATLEELRNLDWSRMKTDAHVEICTFRILRTLGNISNATPWLESQGFRSRDAWNSDNPYIGHEGELVVDAGWNVTSKGLRWPESGFMRSVRSLAVLRPYGTSIQATYTPDGSEVLYVKVSHSRL